MLFLSTTMMTTTTINKKKISHFRTKRKYFSHIFKKKSSVDIFQFWYIWVLFIKWAQSLYSVFLFYVFIYDFLYIAIRHQLEMCCVCWVYFFYSFLSDFDVFFFFIGLFVILSVVFHPLGEYVLILANSYGLRWTYLEYCSNGRHAVMMLMWMPWLTPPAQMHSSVCRQSYAVHWTCYLMLQSIGPSPVQWYQDQHMVAQCISNESINAKFSKNWKTTMRIKRKSKFIRIGDCYQFYQEFELNIHEM